MCAEKIIMNRLMRILGIFLLTSLTWTGLVSAAENPIQLELASPTIKISTFYNGTTLDVTGTVPADMNVLLTLSGPKNNVELKVKGKMAGLLWMNKMDVELENTPAVYLVYTPEKTGTNLLGAKVGIGYKALIKGITIKPESEDKDFVFGEYIKLMEKSGVYGINQGSIKYGIVKNNKKTFSVTMTIPPKMNAGAYQAEAFAVKDGNVVGHTSKDLTLELSGLPKVIASLAFGHPLLFGIMAVFIAVATGLIIGVLFKGGGGSH